jgi:4-amino-4-deoxy-L-arabinose transferase-like glycosyltransferase
MESASSGPPPTFPGDVSRRFSLIVLAMIAILYVATCFTPVIMDENEGLYAGAIREMIHRGDWLVPTNNGFPRVQKPPLIYWTMLASTSLFGLNEFALRLPNALATAGWIAAIYLVMRRLGGERLGIYSALILATTIGTHVFTTGLQPEPFLTLFIMLSIWCLVEALYSKRAPGGVSWYLLFWIFLALGCLSKGLHGALWPLGAVVLTAVLVPGSRAWLQPVASFKGFLLFLIILVPWYAYMAWHWPGFLAAHFLNEQIAASVSLRYPYNTFFPVIPFYLHQLVALMPWIMAAPAAVYRVATWRGTFPGPVKNGICLVTILGLLQIASLGFSSHLTYYGLDYWGLVAAFLALPWLDVTHPKTMPRFLLILPCAGIAVIGLIYLWLSQRLAVGAPLPPPASVRSSLATALFWAAPSTGQDPLALVFLCGAGLLAGGLAATWFCWQRRSLPAVLTLSAALLGPYLLCTASFTSLAPYFSFGPAAQVINREIASQPDALVFWDGIPIDASSLYYHLNIPPRWVNAQFEDQYAQRVLGLGKDYYLDEPAFLSLWKSPRPVYLILNQDRLGHWKELLPPGARQVFAAGQRLVLCNH